MTDCDVRHWYIQKPIKTNKPIVDCDVVFQEFIPSVSRQGFEWVKVLSHCDLQKAVGKNYRHYIEICKENTALKQELEELRSGKRGACSTCEPVGELNLKLVKALEEIESGLGCMCYADIECNACEVREVFEKPEIKKIMEGK